REDQFEMELHLERLRNSILKSQSRAKWESVNYDLMEAILLKNVSKIEISLNNLLRPVFHKHFNPSIATNKIISHPAAGWAKLSWLKGMEVEVKHPLIPKELLPVQPLSEYPEYEFMMNDPDSCLE
ncbi:MAG: immunity 49 family protein, partial [Sphingobacteriaceae bacterium]|nr:immunity 49 family protein [Cytophagaceae bacterium]